MTAKNDLHQGSDVLRGTALALDCLTTALRLVPIHAPWEKFEAMVWRCAARTAAVSVPPAPVQRALENEIRKLLRELKGTGL